jgi:hypothetical protein
VPEPGVATAAVPAFRLNFEEALRFVGRDRRWPQKLGLGALFSLFSIVIVGAILVQGYLLILAERVARAEPAPLPEWDDWGEILRRGAIGTVVTLAYCLPLIVLGACFGLLFIPIVAAGASSSSAAGGGAAGAASLLIVLLTFLLIPVALAVGVVIPAAHAQLILHGGDLAAAFRLGEVFRFMRRHLGQYALLLVLTYAASSVLGQLGYFLCLIGIFATTFLAQLFQYHLIGQLCWYDRLARGVPGGADGGRMGER